MRFSIYRYNPETDSKPYMKNYELEIPHHGENPLHAI